MFFNILVILDANKSVDPVQFNVRVEQYRNAPDFTACAGFGNKPAESV
jgi:hypothetical protein